MLSSVVYCFFFSSRRRHTRYWRDWSSDVCSSDLHGVEALLDREVLVDLGELLGLDLLDGDGELGGPARELLRPVVAGEVRSEERRVGKECRSRWSPYH